MTGVQTCALPIYTATHLIHRSLRSVLGEQAQQSGSLVQPSRLRFDFSHFQALSPEELRKVEDACNRMVQEDAQVTWSEMPIDEARRQGAVALFGEKYGETVRMVHVCDVSKELCGGTHVSRTGQIGQIQIVSETAVAAGVRRIEAVAGLAALERVRSLGSALGGLAERFGVGAEEVPARVAALISSVAAFEKASAARRHGQLDETATELLASAAEISSAGNRRVVVSRQDSIEMDDLLGLGDRLRDGGISVAVLGTVKSGRCALVVMVDEVSAKAGVDAVSIVRKASALVGGSGGGKPHLAQAGGKNPEHLDAALAAGREEATAQLQRVYAR